MTIFSGYFPEEEFFAEKMSAENPGELCAVGVQISMRIHVATMICATLVNTQTHTRAAFTRLRLCTISSAS